MIFKASGCLSTDQTLAAAVSTSRDGRTGLMSLALSFLRARGLIASALAGSGDDSSAPAAFRAVPVSREQMRQASWRCDMRRSDQAGAFGRRRRIEERSSVGPARPGTRGTGAGDDENAIRTETSRSDLSWLASVDGTSRPVALGARR